MTDRADLNSMMTGFMATQLLSIAARLGIADLVAGGPRTATELADQTRTHARSLYRFLRALTTFGVFAELDGEHFENTALSERLRTDVPGSLRNGAIDIGDVSYRVWAEAMHTIRTGEPAAERVLGMRAWEYRAQDPEAGEIFNRSMAESAASRVLPLLEWPWSGDETVVDVGGGNGALLIALLKRHSGLRGVVYDLPHTARQAEQAIADAGLDDRCSAVGGSFLETLPAGDVYVFSAVLCDWADEQATSVLRRAREAMTDDGKVLIIESLVPEGPEPHTSKLADIYLLVAEGGHVRTMNEWRAMLGQVGLGLAGVRPSDRWSLLDVRPPGSVSEAGG